MMSGTPGSLMLSFRMILLSLMLAFSGGCTRNYREQQDNDREGKIAEHLTNANRIMVGEESKDIDDFVARHQFEMQQTGSGLRIEVYQQGKGIVPKLHDAVSVSYTLYLLTGDKCYFIDPGHPLIFKIGESDQLRGIQEAVTLMKEGSHARLVLPSHLAYGMSGDGDKVPGASPVYIDLQLLKVNP